MPERKVLNPRDFPISTDKAKLITDTGEKVAEATSPHVAEDLVSARGRRFSRAT